MDILRISDLHKSFGSKKVLKGLSMTVPEGSIFGFIGKNGAGKTTSMKAALGLLEWDKGEITILGERVEFGKAKTNRHIGYLPDVPEFYSFMTAREYLRFCGELCKMESGDIKKRSDELLSLVGLSGEKHRIKGYSRGMKQRLGIAQALLGRPRLLICDEPSSALDPVGRREILDILSSLKGETTVLFSTHILSDVERICTDIAFLEDGVIKAAGKLSDIKGKYRKNEYTVETASNEALSVLLESFKALKRTGDRTASLVEGETSIYDVLRFVGERRIPVIRAELSEPTLENVFMEVIEK
ncbi:MAG: ABC transporter ATP-binding protein [Clostridia bacterium]|nr:ABC transporter ATP-binding protein [Clostridia bacterium]